MPSLYTRANNEYINQDELAKRIAFERTISQVNKYYGDEKEVSIKPGQLTSQLRYGFDSLFENFRNAIEQVLAEEYNGDLTNQKTYEVIKKYNQLSSYLKNIMNMKQLSDKDQEEIQAKFNELKDKLNLLKKIAIDNQFLDSDDIVEMVDKLNNVTADKKQEIKSVPATSAKMVKTLENKTDAESMINESGAKLQSTLDKLNSEELSNSTKLPDFMEQFTEISKFFNDPNLNPLEYPSIKTYSDSLKTLDDDVSSDMKWFSENRDKIGSEVIEIDDLIKDMDNDINTFFQGLIKNAASKLDTLKNNEIGSIKEGLDPDLYENEVEIVKEKYSDEYVQEVLDRISQGLNYIQNKEYKNIDKSIKYFEEYNTIYER